MTTEITPAAAKKLLCGELDRLQLPYTRLTARTIDFTDLARARRVFVCVHGWKPSPAFDDLRLFARPHGFCVEAFGC